MPELAPGIWGEVMIAALIRAAVLAVACSVGIAGASAQQASNDYLPPKFVLVAKAPAQAGAPKTAQPQGGQKTIGLVSIVGDGFMVKTVGVTVFGNEMTEVPIGGWKVDDRVAAKVTQMLSRNFRVKRIPVPAGTYAKYNAANPQTDYREVRRKLVVDFASKHPCDYYLLVAPGGSQVGDTNQGIGGIGTLRTTVLFNPVQHVFALTELTVYDPKFERLRWEYGTIGQARIFVAIKGPNQKLEDNQHLPQDPQAATNDPRARQIALDLLDKSLAMTVPKVLAVE